MGNRDGNSHFAGREPAPGRDAYYQNSGGQANRTNPGRVASGRAPQNEQHYMEYYHNEQYEAPVEQHYMDVGPTSYYDETYEGYNEYADAEQYYYYDDGSGGADYSQGW